MGILETQQTGGNHYKSMGIQPIEMAYANAYDACVFSALKYLSRHRRKNGAEDLSKAVDFIDFRVELIGKHDECEASERISITQYLASNRITDPREKEAMAILHYWALGKLNDPAEGVKVMKGLINDLRVELYQKGT